MKSAGFHMKSTDFMWNLPNFMKSARFWKTMQLPGMVTPMFDYFSQEKFASKISEDFLQSVLEWTIPTHKFHTLAFGTFEKNNSISWHSWNLLRVCYLPKYLNSYDFLFRFKLKRKCLWTMYKSTSMLPHHSHPQNLSLHSLQLVSDG